MKLSIVVPTHNKADSLYDLLLSIRGQDFSKDQFEVIVINDGSNDHTRAVCQSFRFEIKNFVYYEHAPRGIAISRNAGIRLSQSEFICFLEDDYVIPKDYITKMLSCFSDESVEVVKPLMEAKSKRIFQNIELHLYHFNLYKNLFARGLPTEQKGFPTFPVPGEIVRFERPCEVSGAAMMRRSLFDRYGRFIENLESGEDIEFGQRIGVSGVHSHLLPSVRVKIEFRPTLFSQLQRIYEYGLNRSKLFPDSAWKEEAKFGQFLRRSIKMLKYTYEVCRFTGSRRRFMLYYPYAYVRQLCFSFGAYRGSKRAESRISSREDFRIEDAS